MEIVQLLSNCYQRNLCEAEKPWFCWVFRFSYLIPTRSYKARLKQFCIGDLAWIILILCILHRIWAIRFFVANMLPQSHRRRDSFVVIAIMIYVISIYMRFLVSSTFSRLYWNKLWNVVRTILNCNVITDFGILKISQFFETFKLGISCSEIFPLNRIN